MIHEPLPIEWRSHPLWLRRAAIIIICPFCVALDAAQRLWDQLRPLPVYWRADTAETMAQARAWWRR